MSIFNMNALYALEITLKINFILNSATIITIVIPKKSLIEKSI